MKRLGIKLTEERVRYLKRLRLVTKLRPRVQLLRNQKKVFNPPFPPYDIGRFETNPIVCKTQRYPGWIRKFDGPLYVEYGTGFFYNGIQLIFNSWDGSGPLKSFPATNPLSRFVQSIERLDEAIVLKSYADDNYYHFINDVIEKIPLVEQSDISPDIPYVVEDGLLDLPFYKDAIRLNLFGSRPIYVHKKGTWIQANRLYNVHPDRFFNQSQRFIQLRVGIEPAPSSRRRIYISRSKFSEYGRGISNEDDLIPMLIERNFEILDPGKFPIEEQGRIFASASVVVGAHGAGLTNILFRADAPMALVEFIGDGKVWRQHYYEYCQFFDFHYTGVLGKAHNRSVENSPFELDISEAVSAIDSALDWERQKFGG